MKKLVVILALFATPLAAQAAPEGQVSQARMKADVERMVAFGTRHTLSSQTDPERGIGAAVDWGANRFRAVGRDCRGCLTVVLPEKMVQGDRIPAPVRLRNAIAIQRGTERPNEVVIIQAHIDSRVSDPLDFTKDAPGANDDASGSALVLEAARILSRRKYPVTIVYALLSGEEQGLFGGRLLAEYAAAQGWQVKAVLNNDIVGNSCGSDGKCEPDVVRVFSEGPRFDLTQELRAAQRRNGGENDSPSRNLSRFVAGLDDAAFQVRPIWRTDRMGRGGDQIPFLESGYPAIRFSVGIENYNHQHQDLRTESGIEYGDTIDKMDFAYLARVTALNIRTADRLARAPMPPAPTMKGAVSTDTVLEWLPVPGAASYAVWQRRTDEADWPASPVATSAATGVKLESVRGDDWIFGVSACTSDGVCSPVASAVPAGQFAPVAVPK
ncbi:M20/M25/M40 family metallo-hydrolase [Qipengyuania sediminis]|uniref:M20/M25/M40 family metallo-hydrolase n=1 Tax=Qipengyuania sediminis TaxID=1532023 RepID=UPI001059893C|nr:M20/M25/M40 family metallo-hydrolase [Qipengyuania sediminis]